MLTKLTLTIDKDIIKKAKQYARNKNSSLSKLVEAYLKALTIDKEDGISELSPLTKSLKGAFKMPEGFDYKEELGKSLSEKYEG